MRAQRGPTQAPVAAFVRDHLECTAQSRSPCCLCTVHEIEEATGIKAAMVHVERRGATDDPDRSPESLRAAYALPWKWVSCPHSCGYVDQPEIRPSILYGLVPQICPTATPTDPGSAH